MCRRHRRKIGDEHGVRHDARDANILPRGVVRGIDEETNDIARLDVDGESRVAVAVVGILLGGERKLEASYDHETRRDELRSALRSATVVASVVMGMHLP